MPRDRVERQVRELRREVTRRHNSLRGREDEDAHPQYSLDGHTHTIGPGGGDAYYRHIQGTPQTVWTVTHNLGKFPSVTAKNNSGIEFKAEVDHIDTNSLTITLAFSQSGEAVCN